MMILKQVPSVLLATLARAMAVGYCSVKFCRCRWVKISEGEGEAWSPARARHGSML